MPSTPNFADRIPPARDGRGSPSRRDILGGGAAAAVAAASTRPAMAQTATPDQGPESADAVPMTHYRTRVIDGVKIFYRGAGRPDALRSCCSTVFRPHRTCFATCSRPSPLATG